MEQQAVEDNEPPTYKELTNEFVDNTNCNGIANIKRSNHVVRKAFWTLLVLAGAALTVKLLVEVFTKFFSYPVSISVNVTYESTVRFPAVTLCNVNMIRKSQLGLMNGSSALDKLTFTVGGNPDITAWATSEGRAMLRHSFVDGWTQLNDTVKKQQGHQIEEMLLDCSYNGENCGPSNFTHFINPNFGNCYTFNSNWENQTILYSHQPGPFYGLMLELFIEQDEYIPELTEVAGVIASIHHQEVMPFPADDGVLIPPDMSSSVSITAETITRKERPYPSDCLNATFKDAAKFSAYSDIHPVRYTHAACYKTCYQAHLFSECDCGDPSMPLEGQALYNLVTDKNKKRAVCTTQDEISCELKVYKQYANSELECNCSVACEDHIYTTSVMSLRWPSANYKTLYYGQLATRNPHLATIMQSYIVNGTNPGEHLVKLFIYFNEFNFNLIEEYASYPPSSLLSDLGGAIGFYLGISVIAAFEFIEYIFDLIFIGCKKLKTKKANEVKSVR